MVKLLDDEKKSIDAAIESVEANLSIALKAVLVPSSCRYNGWVTICALVTAFLVGILSVLFLSWLTPGRLLLIELASLSFCAVFYEIPWIKLLIVPNQVEKKAVWRQARLLFADTKLRAKNDEPLLLFYCSQAERYAEILVDERIAAHVPKEVWQTILNGFKPHMRRKDIGAAFVHVVEESGKVLAAQFARS